MNSLTARPPLPALTSLRFFAAAAVVIFHFQINFPGWVPGIVRGWAGSGYQAVTFFFVLSGFILAYVYSGTSRDEPLKVSSSHFLLTRFARIAPCYYLALLLAAPSFYYAAFVEKAVPLHDFFPALLLVPAMLQAWYPPISFSWNGPAWSLSVEVFFYVLFPTIYRLTSRMSLTSFFVLAASWVCVASITRLAMASVDGREWPGWDFFTLYYPVLHLGSFLFGMWIGAALLFGSKTTQAAGNCMLALGVVGILGLLGYREHVPEWALTDAVLVPLYGCVIVGTVHATQNATRMLRVKWLVVLGDASYGLYILHIPLLFWFRQVTNGFMTIAVMSALFIAASLAVRAWVERPARAWIMAVASRKPDMAATEVAVTA